MFWIVITFLLLGYVYLVNKLGPKPQTSKYKIFAFLGVFPVVIFAVVVGAIVYVSILESPGISRWDAEQLLFNGVETNYYKDDGEIFYRSLSGPFTKPEDIVLPDVDLDTFAVVDPLWAKDKNTVYYRYEKTSLDPITFHIIDMNIRGEVTYVSDKTGVYYSPGIYAGDIEFMTGRIEAFKEMSGLEGYWTDGQKVFAGGVEIVGADPATFEVLNDHWARDKKLVFSGRFAWSRPESHIVPNAVPGKLITFGNSRYAAINDKVYYVDYKYDEGYHKYTERGRIVAGAQAESFRVEDIRVGDTFYDAEDDSGYYHFGVKK